MQQLNVFPTAISHTVDIELAKKVLPIAKKYLADKSLLTYEWGYKNTYTGGQGLATAPDLQFFVDYILAAGKEHLNASGYDADRIKLQADVFVSEMVEGDYHKAHAHPGSILSGILYLDIPPGSSNIVFTDPRTHHNHMYLPVKTPNQYNSPNFKFDPVPGLMLIWQSWLVHEVPKNNSKDGRITIVFNLGD